MNQNDQFLSACIGEVPENLRDEFAKIVLSEVVTPDLVGQVGDGYVSAEMVAKSVYAIASALMKERAESLGTLKFEVTGASSSELMAAMSSNWNSDK